MGESADKHVRLREGRVTGLEDVRDGTSPSMELMIRESNTELSGVDVPSQCVLHFLKSAFGQ